MFTTDHPGQPAGPEAWLKELTTPDVSPQQIRQASAHTSDKLGPWLPVDLGEIWRRLTTCDMEVSSHHNASRRCLIRLAPTMHPCFLSERQIEILARVLCGDASKVVASEFDCAPSTVSASLRGTLAAMGIGGSARAIPMFLVVMARASRRTVIHADLHAEAAVSDDGTHWVALDRVESDLPTSLSAAEQDVVRALVAGESYLQIAAKRRSASRTIANQIASAYAKLRVSGRLELMNLLLALRCQAPQLPQTAA